MYYYTYYTHIKETITTSFHSNELKANNVKTCLNSDFNSGLIIFKCQPLDFV